MRTPDDATPVDGCSSLNGYPTLDGIAHKASNEALSILMGINMLATLPESVLSPHQVRALKLLETSASNLVQLMDDLKSTDVRQTER